MNLVWDPLNNAPNAPSKLLLSKSTVHFKGREGIVWEKKG
jgi:hypothetical protein